MSDMTMSAARIACLSVARHQLTHEIDTYFSGEGE
jgi:hypothetical protein